MPDAARTYFDAFATEDLSRMGAMLDSSVEGSAASLYATHQIAVLRSIGTTGGTTRVDAGDGSIALITTGFDMNGDEVEDTVDYSDFTVEDGSLTGFSVDGVPVADRIRAGDPVGTSADGVTVRIVTAYHTARGDLTLNVDVVNAREEVVNIADYDWSLVTADGRQVAPSEAWFAPAPDVEPGATAGHTVMFEHVPLGGTMRFVAFANDFMAEIRFDVAVPA